MLYNIDLSVHMRLAGTKDWAETARAHSRELNSSAAQQLAHRAVSGRKRETGGLLGSGTISGAGKRSRGSPLELIWGGDERALTGWDQGQGYRIGFGECVGRILPAPTDFPAAARASTENQPDTE